MGDLGLLGEETLEIVALALELLARGFLRRLIEIDAGPRRRLDAFDLFSSEQDDLATAIFGDSIQLPFDGEGRIVLPPALVGFAGLSEQAAFIGLGAKFQIWDPDMFERRKAEARERVKTQGLTLPKGGAA